MAMTVTRWEGVRLSSGRFRRASSDEDLIRLIREGIPNTLMIPKDNLSYGRHPCHCSFLLEPCLRGVRWWLMIAMWQLVMRLGVSRCSFPTRLSVALSWRKWRRQPAQSRSWQHRCNLHAGVFGGCCARSNAEVRRVSAYQVTDMNGNRTEGSSC